MSDYDSSSTTTVRSGITGLEIDMSNPQPEQFSIVDIAYGTASESRYSGLSPKNVNVAQHQTAAAQLLEHQDFDPETQLYGLLHDAQEAYLGDMAKPVKNTIPEFEVREDELYSTILESFGLPEPTLEQEKHVKFADNQLFFYEQPHVFPGDPEGNERKQQGVLDEEWRASPEEVCGFLDDHLTFDEPKEVSRENFLTTFHRLMDRV